jgi:hypothetical protein
MVDVVAFSSTVASNKHDLLSHRTPFSAGRPVQTPYKQSWHISCIKLLHRTEKSLILTTHFCVCGQISGLPASE